MNNFQILEKLKVAKSNFIEKLLVDRDSHKIEGHEMKLISDFFVFIEKEFEEESKEGFR